MFNRLTSFGQVVGDEKQTEEPSQFCGLQKGNKSNLHHWVGELEGGETFPQCQRVKAQTGSSQTREEVSGITGDGTKQ